jgi:magnesium-transporting ATPase (P-type)
MEVDDKDSASINRQQELVGSHLDREMFRSCGWRLQVQSRQGLVASIVPNSSTSTTMPTQHILRRFDFNQTLQRRSVVVEEDREDRPRFACVKGSAEKVLVQCRPETIPHGLMELVAQWSRDGYYILACGSKPLDDRATPIV